jgi:glycosyltransferase involved in cell wall biosynthesis
MKKESTITDKIDITERHNQNGRAKTSMKKTIVVCGLPHISAKIARHYQMLRDMTETDITVYSRDVTGNSKEISQVYGVEWEKVHRGTVADIRGFYSLLKSKRILHIELYHDAQSNRAHLFYILAARMFLLPYVIFCRGGEILFWEKHSSFRKLTVFAGLFCSHLVLYKQLHMTPRLKKLLGSSSKTHFFHNRVPFKAQKPKPVIERNGVLFLNSWRSIRRPDIAVDVSLRMANRFPDFRFTIAGERTWTKGEKYSGKEFKKKIEAAGFADQIQILPWVKTPDQLFAKHSVFLLPADPVFLNYTLIEAMERGLVPIIPEVQGAERIVENGKDGLIVDFSTDAFSEATEYLLSNRDKLQEMSCAARKKIKSHFELRTGFQELISVYQSMVWK